MAQRNKSGECVQRRMRRYLFTSSGRLLLALMVVSVLMVLINVNFSSTVFDKTTMATVKGNVLPYFVESTAEISPEERERRKQVAVFKRILHKQLRKQRRGDNYTRCIHPKLDLKHDTNQFAYFDLPPLNCTGNGMFHSKNGVLVLNRSVIPDPSLVAECLFFPLTRENDNIYSYGPPETKNSSFSNISIPHDFVRIRCVLKSTVEENKAMGKDNHRMDSSEDDDSSENENYGQYKRKLLGEDAEGESSSSDKAAPRGNKGLEGDRNPSVNETAPDDKPAEGEEQTLDDYDREWKAYFLGSEEFIDPEMVWSDYDQFLVQVHPRPEVFQRIAKVEAASGGGGGGAMKLNVLMFALDSMSHLSYQRKLPLTYRYLREELGALVFENYNIVGDATTAAIIPMLTGKTEMDLPEVRLSKMEAGMVDEYPLVWKNFSARGYATLFAEDEPSLATFNLRLNGFRASPTDHYMRTFWLALWDSSLRQGSARFCTGNTPHHRFMLRYLEDFFLAYGNVSRFAFGFQGELSHGDNNPAQHVDADLRDFLRRLKRRKVLEDTVVIVFADHGARYSKVRNTVQGKLEERLPLMSFVVPRKFQQRYPRLYRNLKTNTQRLATPFDIHETLQDLADLSRTSRPLPPPAPASPPGGGGYPEASPSPGISLLREIPADRTCKDAGIGMHWCACLHLVRLDTDEEVVKPAAMALLWHLNVQTDRHRDRCALLELTMVLSVHMVVPNEKVLKYRRSKDSDQRVANFSHDINIDVVHYQLQVETQPCGALYEATVMADFRNYSDYQFQVTPGISRINKYGDQPKCIQEQYPALRKFCCCRDYLKVQGGTSDRQQEKEMPGRKEREKQGMWN